MPFDASALPEGSLGKLTSMLDTGEKQPRKLARILQYFPAALLTEDITQSCDESGRYTGVLIPVNEKGQFAGTDQRFLDNLLGSWSGKNDVPGKIGDLQDEVCRTLISDPESMQALIAHNKAGKADQGEVLRAYRSALAPSGKDARPYISGELLKILDHLLSPECAAENAMLLARVWCLLGALLQQKIDILLMYYDETLQRNRREYVIRSARAVCAPDGGMSAAEQIQSAAVWQIVTRSDLYYERTALLDRMPPPEKAPKITVISGQRGGGKSELLRAYGTRHFSDGDPASGAARSGSEGQFLWLVFREGYSAAGFERKTRTFAQLLEDNGLLSQQSRFGALGAESVVVIDNLDFPDLRLLEDTISRIGNARLMISTRLVDLADSLASEGLSPEIREYDLDRESDCQTVAVEVFQKCFGMKLSQDELLCLNEICDRLNNNLMYLSFLASRADIQGGLDDIRRKLESCGILRYSGYVPGFSDAYVHDRVYLEGLDRVTRYVFADLLDEDSFSPIQAQCVALLSLLPGVGVERGEISLLLGDNDASGDTAAECAIEDLIKRRVLLKSGNEIQLHPLMADILRDGQPKLAALRADEGFFGQILENQLTMGADGQWSLLLRAVVNHVTAPGNDACIRQRLALLMTVGRGDALFAALCPEVPAAILACVDQSSGRCFAAFDCSTKKELTILEAANGYYGGSTAERPVRSHDEPIRQLRLYLRRDPGEPVPLWIPDTLGNRVLTKVPDSFCDPLSSSERSSAGAEEARRFLSLRLPEGLLQIGDCAFRAITLIFDGSLTLPDGLTSIGSHAFSGIGCSGPLLLPSSVRSIGEGAFAGNDFEGDLRLPDGLEAIGKEAFYAAGFDGSLQVDAHLASIPYAAFAFTEFKGSLRLPEGLREICPYAFHCVPFSDGFSLPGSVSVIGECAFFLCLASEPLQLPAKLEAIGPGAFGECFRLGGSLQLPLGLREIGHHSFFNCIHLRMPSAREIRKLRNGGMQIGDRAFSSDHLWTKAPAAFLGALQSEETLASLVSAASNREALMENASAAILEHIREEYLLMLDSDIPVNLETLLNDRPDWKLPGFPEDVWELWIETLGAAYRNKTLSGVLTVPDGIDEIPEGAFRDFRNLEEVRLPTSVDTIGESAFQNCISLRRVNLEEVLWIERESFRGCSSLCIPIRMPSVMELGEFCFADCTSLSGTVADADLARLTELPTTAFENCPGLVVPSRFAPEVTVPSVENASSCRTTAFHPSLRVLKAEYLRSAFVGRLELPPHLEVIRERALFGKTITGDLVIPESVYFIHASAFENSTLSGTIEIRGSITICSRAFANTGIIKVLFCGAEAEIAPSAFDGCSRLKTIAGPADSDLQQFAWEHGFAFEELK